jgi:hypothetical protein
LIMPAIISILLPISLLDPKKPFRQNILLNFILPIIIDSSKVIILTMVYSAQKSSEPVVFNKNSGLDFVVSMPTTKMVLLSITFVPHH